MSTTKRLAVSLFCLGLLAACQTEYETFEPPPLNYSDRTPLRFAVESVSVQSAHRPRGQAPYVEHTMAVTPEAATRALLEQRLRAVGGPGRLQAVIVDASVTEQGLDTQSGVTGYLTTETSALLETRLKVRVDRLDRAGRVNGTVSTAVTRSRGIPEDTGYAARQRIAHQLVLDVVDDLDAALVANLEENYADIVRP